MFLHTSESWLAADPKTTGSIRAACDRLNLELTQSFSFIPNPVAVSTVDKGIYLYVNHAFTEAFGFTEAEIIGKNSLEFPMWTSLEERERAVKRLKDGDRIRGLTAHVRTKAGALLHVIFSAELIKLNGRVYIVSSCIDVTQMKQYESELARLDRMNLMGEMAAGIAHEIRNPMTVIQGYLQIIMKNTDERTQRKLTMVLEELDRVNGIVTDFLALARNKVTAREKKPVNALIESVYLLMMGNALHKNISLILALDRAVENANINEKEIKQVILSIIQNAIEATPPNGTITIVSGREPSGILIKVKDTGCGIPRDKLGKVFDPFYTTKENGTGLGLAVAQSIVERHGGLIEVRSEEEVGTEFIIQLPL